MQILGDFNGFNCQKLAFNLAICIFLFQPCKQIATGQESDFYEKCCQSQVYIQYYVLHMYTGCLETVNFTSLFKSIYYETELFIELLLLNSLVI